ncbi:MAG: ASKHA domain-containing protein [Nitrososphaerota archaeon]
MSKVNGKNLHRLKTIINDREIELWINPSETLLENLIHHGIEIDNLCGGRGICGKCSVKILEGKLSQPSDIEKKWLNILGKDMRLSCQAKTLTDSVIKIERISSASDGKILTWRRRRDIGLKPRITVKTIKLEIPAIFDGRGDLERLLDASHIQNYDPLIVKYVSSVIREVGNEVRVVLYDGEIIDLIPSKSMCRLMGAAVDIGTTTVVLSIYDLLTGDVVATESSYNQQIMFGEDVITRVDYASRNITNVDELRNAIINTINDLFNNVFKNNNLENRYLYEVVCSGNTTMLSFLFGNNFYYSTRAPFIPPFTSSIKVKARDLGIKINSNGYIRTLPSISSYIGSDVVADILSSGLHEYEGIAVLLDIGTNGEIVLKSRSGELLATSCAAGPALEGYGIKHGMRATKGAIESIIIDEEGRSYYRVIGNTKPIGICGSGVVEAVAWMWIRGIIDHSGRMLKNTYRLFSMSGDELQYILVPANEASNLKEITITQSDIRKIQLAKAAIFSAFITLLRIAKISIEDIERVFVAGAFGNYLDIFAAQILGMLPDIPRDRFSFIGNGSLAGAEMMLLSKDIEDQLQEIIKKTKVIELNIVKDFQKEFIDATQIPHARKELFRNVINEAVSLR